MALFDAISAGNMRVAGDLQAVVGVLSIASYRSILRRAGRVVEGVNPVG
jgi:hypothetical protein